MEMEKAATDTVTLEDALQKTEFGKFNYVLITLVGAILCCVFIETVSINFILPVAQCDLNLTSQDKGWLAGVGFIGIITSSHLWGFLADTRGRKTVIVPTLIIAFVLTVMSSFAKSFWLLTLLRFSACFFVSGPSATVYAYLGEFHCGQHRSKVMMLASTAFGVFGYWNPFFGSIIINEEWSVYIEPLDLLFTPWRLFLMVCGIPNIVCAFIMLLFMPESPKFTFSTGDEQRTLKILEKIYVWNTGKSKETFGVKSLVKDEEFEEGKKEKSTNFLHFIWSQTVPLFKHPHLKNTLTACFIQFCIFNTMNGFWAFFPEITNKITIWTNSDSSHVSSTVCQILDDTKYVSSSNDSVSNATLCITKLEPSAYLNAYICNTIYFVGWLFFSFVINRVGKLVILTSILFFCGVCGFSLIFISQPLVSSYVYIVLLVTGLAMTVLNASTVELFPTRLRAMALCLSLMFGRIGSVVGSNIIGSLLDNYCSYTFLIPAILLLSSGCLAFTIPNISTKVSQQNN